MPNVRGAHLMRSTTRQIHCAVTGFLGSLLVFVPVTWVGSKFLQLNEFSVVALNAPFWFAMYVVSAVQCVHKADGQTHCRSCDYILRGIPEPRCPECGERI